MELRRAGCEPDPRCVVTPICVNKTKALLCKYGILADWDHILHGISNGFDVGVKSPPDHTLIFRESCFFSARPRLHLEVHCWGSSCRPLFSRFSPQQAGAVYWPLSDLPDWPCSQAALRQLQDDSRLVLSSEQPPVCFSKQQHQFRRLSDDVGHVRQYSRTDTVFATWLFGCDVRHFCRLPYHPSQAKPAELSLRILGWHGACRQSCNVWFELQCWSLRFGGGHASGHLSSSRLWPPQEVGGRLLCGTASTAFLDRAGFHLAHGRDWGSLESGKAEATGFSPALYRFRLGPSFQIGQPSSRQAISNSAASICMAIRFQPFHSQRSGQSSWQASTYLLHFPINSAFPPFTFLLYIIFYFTQSSKMSSSSCQGRLGRSCLYSDSCPKAGATSCTPADRPQLVGRCKLFLRYRGHNRLLLGSMEMGARLQSWTTPRIRYWLGRGCSSGAGTAGSSALPVAVTRPILGTFRQCGCRCSHQQGTFSKCTYKRCFTQNLLCSCQCSHIFRGHLCREQNQYHRRPLSWRHRRFSQRFPSSIRQDIIARTNPPHQSPITVLTYFSSTELVAPLSVAATISPSG